jgi:hypothetical protein
MAFQQWHPQLTRVFSFPFKFYPIYIFLFVILSHCTFYYFPPVLLLSLRFVISSSCWLTQYPVGIYGLVPLSTARQRQHDAHMLVWVSARHPGTCFADTHPRSYSQGRSCLSSLNTRHHVACPIWDHKLHLGTFYFRKGVRQHWVWKLNSWSRGKNERVWKQGKRKGKFIPVTGREGLWDC